MPEDTKPARVPYDACPLCGDPAIIDLREVDCTKHECWQPGVPPTIEWCRCHRCSHVFASGYLNDAALALVLGTTVPGQEPGFDLELQRWRWAEVVERVTRHLAAPPGRWLDVGFGDGALLFTAAEWGYRATGIDLREASVARLRQLGIDAHCRDIYAVDEPGAYQVVSMADVIEHMPFPRAAIEQARKLLAPGGRLLISTPNMDTAVWRELDRVNDNPYWRELEHYHCFTRERLYALLTECGFGSLQYSVSTRYRSGMDVIAALPQIRVAAPGSRPAPGSGGSSPPPRPR